MKLPMKKAVALFEAMGYQTASNWGKDKMEKKMLKLAELAADSPDLGTDEMNDLLDELLACESVITVTEDAPEDITAVHDETEAEAEVKSKGKGKKKKGSKKKKEVKEETPKEEKSEPAPKKVKAEKKAPKKKETGPTRVGLCAKYIMSCSEPITLAELQKNADAMFAASGGTSNESEAKYARRVCVQVLEGIEAVKVENDVLTVL